MVFLFHSLTLGDDMMWDEELIDRTPLLTHLLLHYLLVYYYATTGLDWIKNKVVRDKQSNINLLESTIGIVGE